jgi:CheY-like chemotaxis protein
MSFDGLKVLVVEDEGPIAFLLEDMLQELGFEIAASVATLAGACRAAEVGGFDFAVLDVNLKGERSFPAAQILQSRKIPFVFSTGYGSAGLPPEFAGHPVVSKPFSQGQLHAKISSAMAAGR